MTDPFEALREPVTPVDPDPEFAGRLRMRLTREVFAPPGGTMSQQTVATLVERDSNTELVDALLRDACVDAALT